MSTSLEICLARGFLGTETHLCKRLYWEDIDKVTDTPSNQALHEYVIAEAQFCSRHCRAIEQARRLLRRIAAVMRCLLMQ